MWTFVQIAFLTALAVGVGILMRYSINLFQSTNVSKKLGGVAAIFGCILVGFAVVRAILKRFLLVLTSVDSAGNPTNFFSTIWNWNPLPDHAFVGMVIQIVLVSAVAIVIGMILVALFQQQNTTSNQQDSSQNTPTDPDADKKVSLWAFMYNIEEYKQAVVYWYIPILGRGAIYRVKDKGTRGKLPLFQDVVIRSIRTKTAEFPTDPIQTLGMPGLGADDQDYFQNAIMKMGQLSTSKEDEQTFPVLEEPEEGPGLVEAKVKFIFQVAWRVRDHKAFAELEPKFQENVAAFIESLVAGRLNDAVPAIYFPDTYVLQGEHLLTGRRHHILGYDDPRLLEPDTDELRKKFKEKYGKPGGKQRWAHLRRLSYAKAAQEYITECEHDYADSREDLDDVLRQVNEALNALSPEERRQSFFKLAISDKQANLLRLINPDSPLLQLRNYGIEISIFERQRTEAEESVQALIDEQTKAKLRRRIERTVLTSELDRERKNILTRMLNARTSAKDFIVRIDATRKYLQEHAAAGEQIDMDTVIRTAFGDEFLRVMRLSPEGKYFLTTGLISDVLGVLGTKAEKAAPRIIT